jgi:tRNA isopentenyl-2-thiomethyl-A-37 hydroxylase MiaE
VAAVQQVEQVEAVHRLVLLQHLICPQLEAEKAAHLLRQARADLVVAEVRVGLLEQLVRQAREVLAVMPFHPAQYLMAVVVAVKALSGRTQVLSMVVTVEMEFFLR